MNIIVIDMYFNNSNVYNFQKVFHKINPNIIINVLPYNTPNLIKKIKLINPIAIIISGSKFRILEKDSPSLPLSLLKLNKPILGICYGYQWLVKILNGQIGTFDDSKLHNYKKKIIINYPFYVDNKFYEFTHHDYIKQLPLKWKNILQYDNQIWIASNTKNKFLGIQFHPEKHLSSGIPFFKAWISWIIN
jgi:GMP synthase (glutamine-hydrolysing)